MCGSFPGLLIGRTAVHSGKDPAFAAYDQFLSTGILQPLSQDEVRYGSDSVVRRCPHNVRIPPESGSRSALMRCRTSAISGHCRHSPNGRYGTSARASQSGLMLAARMTLPHFSVSSAMSLPKSVGEPVSTVPPRSAIFHVRIGESRIDLLVECVDDLAGHVPGCADASRLRRFAPLCCPFLVWPPLADLRLSTLNEGP